MPLPVFALALTLAGLTPWLPLLAQPAEFDLSRYRGVARASQDVTLAAPSDGVLMQIRVDEGERVNRGAVIAALDDRVQRAVVEAALLTAQNDAPVQRAKASVRFAELELQRVTEMVANGGANPREAEIAEVQLHQALADQLNAENQLRLQEAQLKLERQRLDELQITAPFDGLVLRRLAEPGAALRVADPVVRVIALEPLEARLPLPSDFAFTMAPGEAFALQAGAPVNRPVAARLLRIQQEVDPASGTAVAVFEIPNPFDPPLPAGLTVHLLRTKPIAAPAEPTIGE